MDRFQAKIWDYYHRSGRHNLPWRLVLTPYGVLISEVMLQQTQVSRVLLKYPQWLEKFPDFTALAVATGPEVLAVWQGLGYNRRGLWLREAARRVVDEYGGVLPRDPAELVKLPGIGANTAGSIAAFAYNEPVVFIETNIRRVFINEFFAERVAINAGDATGGDPDPHGTSVSTDGVPTAAGPAAPISDAQLRPLIADTLDREHPREWYWALMDYGAYLAKQVPNPNRRSKHYARQSKFEGSARQIRGEVLRQLLAGQKTLEEFDISDDRLAAVLTSLAKDGLIEHLSDKWRLAQ